MHIDRSGSHRCITAPNVHEQLVTTENPILVRKQEQEQSILLWRERHETVVYDDAMPDGVDRDTAGRNC